MSEEDRKSQYQRKLARQSKLELMEAAATGTAPSMELDLNAGGMRSRGGGPAGAKTSYVGGDAPASYNPDQRTSLSFSASTSPNPTRASSNPFSKRGSEEEFSVNLMDHDAGVYKEDAPSRSLFSTISKLITFDSRKTSEEAQLSTHHETIPSEPDFLGKAGPPTGKVRPDGSSHRVSACFMACSSMCSCCGRMCSSTGYYMREIAKNPRRRRIFFMVLAGLVGIILSVYLFRTDNAATKYYQHHVTEPYLREQNTIRFNEIMDHIVMKSISHTDVFRDLLSPEYHALRWVAYSDPQNLDPADPILLQRYALAVVFYNSFITFETVAGRQQPITVGDEQWEGVPNPGWKRKDYWMSKHGICMWFGVECDPNEDDEVVYDGNSHVRSITLKGNRVMGKLAPELKALEQLQYLDLSHNNIEGRIPWQVAKMFQIETLFLFQNDLTGPLPPEIGFWEGMQYLKLGHNKFTGTIPTEINRLYNLKVLALDSNELSGQIPNVKSLSNLEQVYLDNNSFKGYFPFTLIFLTNLLELHLYNNELSGTIPPELENLRHVRNLYLQNNKLKGTIPDAIFTRMHHLKEIALEYNELTGDLPKDLGSEHILTMVRFNNNKLTGSIPTEWDQMGALSKLHLQFNRLTGIIPTTIANFLALEELYLNNNKFGGMIPTEIGLLENLQEISIEDNELIDRVPTWIGTLEELHTFRLHNNQIRGFMPDDVCDLTLQRLKTLTADCRPIDGKIQKCDCCSKCY